MDYTTAADLVPGKVLHLWCNGRTKRVCQAVLEAVLDQNQGTISLLKEWFSKPKDVKLMDK